MLLFSKYLSNTLSIIQINNLKTIVENTKDLKDELESKIKEINHYKESIRFFLKDYNNKKIGLIIYKNNKFKLINKEAEEIIKIDLNKEKEHPLSKAIKKVAENFKYYKTTTSITTNDIEGNKLLISSTINSYDNSLIIIISHCDISDILKDNIDKLKDPSRRDYLLYLETTKLGKLVNQLIPSNSDFFINFKIELLSAALSNKTIILNVNELDVIPIARLINTINFKDNLYILDLKSQENNMNIAEKIFGINDILNPCNKESIIEKLNKNGTLLIKNIEFLSIQTQDILAELLKYGIYSKINSDIKKFADIKIILSSSKDIKQLFEKEILSENFFKTIKNNSLTLPSLSSLPTKEIFEYIDSISHHLFHEKMFEKYVNLSDNEKVDIITNSCNSLTRIRSSVYKILAKKSSNIINSLNIKSEEYDDKDIIVA
jgi:hypothetical protein